MNSIKFSEAAITDLQNIKIYIAEELCNKISSGYRFLICGNYIAIYRVEDRDVYIVRIFYKRENFFRILFE